MPAGGVTLDDHGVFAAVERIARGLGDLRDPLEATGDELLDEIRPLVPVGTARLVGDLKAEADRELLVVSIGTTPRVGDYARIINAYRGRFMESGEQRAEPVAVERLTDAIDSLIARNGLGV